MIVWMRRTWCCTCGSSVSGLLDAASLDERVFLDSDDLMDLRLLTQAVAQSDVLILLQTAHVLERPYCLIELATAIHHNVPIVGVSLTSGPFPYRFAEAASFLKSLDTLFRRSTIPGTRRQDFPFFVVVLADD